MSVRLDGPVIHLEGACRVEDAEPLFALLQADRGRQVNLARAQSLHTSVTQILLALRPTLVGTMADPFTTRWLMPILQARRPDEEIGA
jgi:hypothetical protein